MDLLAAITEVADDLTQPIRHTERIQDRDQHRNLRVRRAWTVTLPCLLDQLAQAVVPGGVYVEDQGDPARSTPRSTPPARLDAIDRSHAIDVGAATWCTRERLTLRDTTVRNIRALVGAAATMPSDTAHQLHTDLRTWRTWAQTVTGWIRPPDTPPAPCPLCAARGALRVRLDKGTACCLTCGAAWDAATIGLLGEHVRAYTAEAERARRAARSAAVADRRRREGVPG